MDPTPLYFQEHLPHVAHVCVIMYLKMITSTLISSGDHYIILHRDKHTLRPPVSHWGQWSHLRACWRWPRQSLFFCCFFGAGIGVVAGRLMHVFVFFPASCWFFAVCASLFSPSVFFLIFCSCIKAGMFICEQTVRHFKDPQLRPWRDESSRPRVKSLTVSVCVRVPRLTSNHFPLQITNFRYFLLNAVTYGPVLYLLSAMQLSL